MDVALIVLGSFALGATASWSLIKGLPPRTPPTEQDKARAAAAEAEARELRAVNRLTWSEERNTALAAFQARKQYEAEREQARQDYLIGMDIRASSGEGACEGGS